MRDELVKVGAANNSLQVIEEVEALLIRHGTVDVLGINIVVVDDEFGVLCVFAELLDGILCAWY